MDTDITEIIDIDRLTDSSRQFLHRVKTHPNLPRILAKMSLVLKEKKLSSDAKIFAHAALTLAPKDYKIRVLCEWLKRREAPLWHFGIIHDEARNEVFAKALKQYIRPDTIVFEIGTGTGILAMLAAQYGAHHVYTCERRRDVALAASEIIARNNLSDKITVIAKDAHAMQLGIDIPERASLFVAENVDNTLLGENVLPLTELARERFLTKDALLLPKQVTAMACLISGQGVSHRYRMSHVMGFDLTPFNRFTPLSIGIPYHDNIEVLSEPQSLISFDLSVNAPREASCTVNFTASKSGTAEAVMRWLHLDFGEDICFDNCPPKRSSWVPQLHLLPEPINVLPGDRVSIEVHHTHNRLFVVPESTEI